MFQAIDEKSRGVSAGPWNAGRAAGMPLLSRASSPLTALVALVASGCTGAESGLLGRDAHGPGDVGPRDVPPGDVDRTDIDDLPDLEDFDVPPLDYGPGTCVCRLAMDGGAEPSRAFSSSTCTPSDVVAPQLCEPRLCGNGVVDSCAFCPAQQTGGIDFDAGVDGGSGCYVEVEACDGTDLGGNTCESLGFAGGTLGCSKGCAFDPTQCAECTGDSALIACGQPIASCGAFAVAVAARMAEIGVAWVVPGMTSGDLHFARLRTDLSLIAEAPVIQLPHGAFDLAVAGTPQGWVIAATDGQNLDVFPLDAAGNSIPGSSYTLMQANTPDFAPRSDGGPLLMWSQQSPAQSGGKVFASLLDPQGREQWRVQVFANTVDFGSAVYTGDGFLLAQREFGGGAQMDGIRIARVDLLGQLSGMLIPVGMDTEFPQLTWNGTRATMVYGSFDGPGTVEYAELDHAGNLIGSVSVLGGASYELNPAATAGGNTMVLTLNLSPPSYASSGYDVLRVAPNGTVLSTIAVARGQVGGNDYDTHHSGFVTLSTGDAVAAWLGYGGLSRIGLAVIRAH
jgi:hypothetical protein